MQYQLKRSLISIFSALGFLSIMAGLFLPQVDFLVGLFLSFVFGAISGVLKQNLRGDDQHIPQSSLVRTPPTPPEQVRPLQPPTPRYPPTVSEPPEKGVAPSATHQFCSSCGYFLEIGIPTCPACGANTT